MTSILASLLLVGIAEAAPPVAPADPAGPVLSAIEAWDAVASGAAVLVDVREQRETAEGMASPALSMPMSRIEGDPARWRSFLASLPRGRTLIFYSSTDARARRAALNASNLGYKDVGPGNAYGAHYSPGRRGSKSYYVHVRVDSQHRTSDSFVPGPTVLYELVLNSPSAIPLQQIEVVAVHVAMGVPPLHGNAVNGSLRFQLVQEGSEGFVSH